MLLCFTCNQIRSYQSFNSDFVIFHLLGASAGEELWDREQTGAGSEDAAGQEARAAAKTGGCVVPES